jgi:hypothetical protein
MSAVRIEGADVDAETSLDTVAGAGALTPAGAVATTDAVAATAEPPRPTSRLRRTLRPALTLIAAVAVVLGLLLAVRQEDWSSLSVLVRARSIPLLALASFANLVGLVLSMASWRVLLVDMAGPVPLLPSANTYFTGVISKLVPGRVWTLLIHVRFALSVNVTAKRITSVFLASTMVGLLTGAALGLAVAPSLLGSRAYWLVVPTLLVLACLVRPELVGQLSRGLGRLLRRPALVVTASPRAVRRSLVLGLVSWAVSGLNLWIIVTLLGAPALPSLGPCLGGFALATVGGSLVIVLPDGWGVRELLLTVALRGSMPWSLAAVAAVASRMVVLVSELVGGLTALALSAARMRRAKRAVSAACAGPVSPGPEAAAATAASG